MMANSDKKLWIVMPAFNENIGILEIISDLRSEFNDATILIVDDGSRITLTIDPLTPHVYLIRNSQNFGVGAALSIGVRAALGCGAELIVTMDSDGQHPHEEIQKLVDQTDSHDFVIGVREGNAYPWGRFRKIAHSLITKLVSYKTGRTFIDATSGFRAMNIDGAMAMIRNLDYDYLDDTALLYTRLAQEDVSIKEIPVIMRTRMHGNPSHTGLKLSLMYASAMLRILLSKRGSL